jgi:hypothetical protein
VADDATYDSPHGEYHGKEEIQTMMEGLVARRWHVDMEGKRVEGDTVFWTARITMCDPDNPDGRPFEIVNRCQSVVQDGQIILEQSARAR